MQERENWSESLYLPFCATHIVYAYTREHCCQLTNARTMVVYDLYLDKVVTEAISLRSDHNSPFGTIFGLRG
jgi:hypothetical protein